MKFDKYLRIKFLYKFRQANSNFRKEVPPAPAPLSNVDKKNTVEKKKERDIVLTKKENSNEEQKEKEIRKQNDVKLLREKQLATTINTIIE